MSEMPPSSSPPGSFTPPPPPTGAPPPASSERQMMLIFSYVLFLGLVPLIAKPDNREFRWHAKNGLGLFVVYFVASLLLAFIDYYVGIPCVGTLVHCALFIGYAVLVAFGIMKALRGERLRLPVISDIADK